MSTKIKIELQQFLRDGIFGPIHLGMSRAEVESLLGEPDAIGGVSRKYRRPSIWKYGDVEIHFIQGGDSSCLIFLDDFDVPTGGSKIDLNPWIIRRGVARTTMEQALRDAQIGFHEVKRKGFDPTISVISTNAGVELNFLEEREEPDNVLGLYAIAKGLT